MTKETFNKYVILAKGSPIVLFGDNAELFTLNVDGNYYTQTDECVHCFRVNKLSYGMANMSQSDAPYEVVIFHYDEIQYIKIYPRATILSGFIDGTDPVIEGQTIEKIKNAILTSKVLLSSGPKGYNGDGEQNNEISASVFLDKDVDKWVKNAMKK